MRAARQAAAKILGGFVMAQPVRIIFSRPRQFDSLAALAEQAVVRESSTLGFGLVDVVPHLYDLPPEAAFWQELAAAPDHLVVLCALYPRAAYWVLRAHGVNGRWLQTVSWHEEDEPEHPRKLSSSRVTTEQEAKVPAGESGDSERFIWCFDIRGFDSATALIDQLRAVARFVQGLEPAEAAAEAAQMVEHHSTPCGSTASPAEKVCSLSHLSRLWAESFESPLRPRWYPVVDYSRCRNCLHCLNFCLFGVYQLDGAGRLWVKMPDACRDGCPACARLCPTGAIIFPMYADPLIAGADSNGGGGAPAVVGQAESSMPGFAKLDEQLAKYLAGQDGSPVKNSLGPTRKDSLGEIAAGLPGGLTPDGSLNSAADQLPEAPGGQARESLAPGDQGHLPAPGQSQEAEIRPAAEEGRSSSAAELDDYVNEIHRWEDS